MKCIPFGVVLLAALSAQAGVFSGSDNDDLANFIITHPPGFDGTGGELVVRVCVEPGAEQLVPSVKRAIQLWNALTPTVGNCVGCLVDEPEPPTGLFDPVGALLHELGHCAMGLDHTDWLFKDELVTGFTNSNDAVNFLPGDDGVPGTSDDTALPQPPGPPDPARIIHWFRKADNNPVVIDGTVIDGSTFTRSRSDLPAGHRWPANGNRKANEVLGFMNTQSAMYSTLAPGAAYTGITADEVNTVRMGMSGLDETAGTTDDYTVRLVFATGCDSNDDVVVKFFEFSDSTLGECTAFHRLIPDPPKMDQHYALTHSPKPGPLPIRIDSDTPWDFSLLFVDGFEAGDTTGWDVVVP